MDLSFSERLGNIVAISNALTNFTGGKADVKDEARRLEAEIFKYSTSQEEYQLRCDELLVKIEPRSPEPASPAEESLGEEILNLEGPDIGEYAYATFHQDGQMSTIYKAKAKREYAPEPIVALKVTTPSSMLPPHNSQREARILAEARHTNIIPLLETFQQPGGRLVLAFPFLRQDLENLLRSGVLTKRQSSLIFRGLFEALAHIHSLGIIHRDVKPSNILLRTMDGEVYLADFGIAWSPNDAESEPAASKITDVGTTAYRPPELLFGCRNYDTSLDMWAAGCVMAEILKSDHGPLFDAGSLGSELGLIKSMFSTLGTPNDKIWPSARKYPDWGKMRFQEFPAKAWSEILSGVSATAVDFVKRTVCFECTQRMTAREALQHDLGFEFKAN